MVNRYHDYVIKDGRFIGHFEEMYAECDEIPWHQDETARGIYTDHDLAILAYMKRRLGFRSVADIGCGLGYVTSRIKDEVLEKNDVITGFDIALSAIKQARILFPSIRFEPLDILKPIPAELSGSHDLVICKECHWYVLDDVKGFRRNILEMTTNWIYVVQSFPETVPYLGMDTFPSPEAMVNFWLETSCSEYHLIEWDRQYSGRPMLHLFLSKNAS